VPASIAIKSVSGRFKHIARKRDATRAAPPINGDAGSAGNIDKKSDTDQRNAEHRSSFITIFGDAGE
jgi:hypothetical protein